MRLYAALLAAGLLLQGAASAGAIEPVEAGREQPLLAVDVLDSDGTALDSDASGSAQQPLNRVEELPYIGLHPLAPVWNRLGLFAEFRGTTLRARGTTYDLGGGAELFLRKHLALTGSYRVQGYDPGVQGTRLGSALEGPFFGVSVRY